MAPSDNGPYLLIGGSHDGKWKVIHGRPNHISMLSVKAVALAGTHVGGYDRENYRLERLLVGDTILYYYVHGLSNVDAIKRLFEGYMK